MQGQGFGRPVWFNATLDGRAVVQAGKWLVPMDLQQWPKSLPNRGTLELDVLQLPLSKVPWIAKDGSICIGGKQMAPKAAGLPTASISPVAQTPGVTEVIADDETDKPESGVDASNAANSGQQADADADASSDGRLSESDDEGVENDMMGAASSAVQSAPV